MVTELGKFLRKLRIDNDELMKNMADKLNIATSTLSSIENGRRNPPKKFIETLKERYRLAPNQIQQLEKALMQSKDEVPIYIKQMSKRDQDLAVSFARQFANLSDSDKEHIRKILNEKN